ncbi:hypothetical protein DFH08DRAFT_820325 [Mycena albidolilacea]|uniref:Uncharacterized protein n=1 Tax=Mycena albidolilacea TaxID=1033008 RepID=A0AAD6ZDB4_9AGAR|nr:hypothetical protein DFH08DRAFT_820325 [Mycena albidolilacea]
MPMFAAAAFVSVRGGSHLSFDGQACDGSAGLDSSVFASDAIGTGVDVVVRLPLSTRVFATGGQTRRIPSSVQTRRILSPPAPHCRSLTLTARGALGYTVNSEPWDKHVQYLLMVFPKTDANQAYQGMLNTSCAKIYNQTETQASWSTCNWQALTTNLMKCYLQACWVVDVIAKQAVQESWRSREKENSGLDRMRGGTRE